MPVNLSSPQAADLHAVPGVRIGVAEAGVRKAHRKDLTVFLLDEGASVAGVFTQNRFCAAPVQVCREHLAAGQGIRATVIGAAQFSVQISGNTILIADPDKLPLQNLPVLSCSFALDDVIAPDAVATAVRGALARAASSGRTVRAVLGEEAA